MPDDAFGCNDEFEPRKMPRQASKFESLPCPMVPEVSLIMDKPRQSNKTDDTLSTTIPVTRSFNVRDSINKGSESYAAWKEKQFPQQTSKTPLNHFEKSYSSTESHSLQDNHKQAVKSHDSPQINDHNYKTDSPSNESPRKYISRKFSENDNSNKYTLSHAMSCNAIDNINNSYKPRSNYKDERKSSNERRQYDHSYSEDNYEFREKPRMYRCSSYSMPDSYYRSMPMEHDYHLKHSTSLPPVYCNPNYSHNCSCCSSNNSRKDTETVKNLLQVITSQNEQIKSLQRQLERVLKLHEQSLKERLQCSCQPSGILYQNTQVYDQSQTANLPVAHNNLIKDNEKCFSDIKLQDEKSKKTIVEQKVSIGVMTSFELKVQNNPSLENDMKQKNNQEKVVSSRETSDMLKNLVKDTGEMIRKKANFFTPTPLDNISEGSESHMSSLRQSHLYPDINRRLTEVQDFNEVKNTNYYNQNTQETEIIQKHIESRKSRKLNDDKSTKHIANLDYEVREPIYKETNDDIEDRGYQYNLEYENLRYTSQEDLNDRKSDEFNAEPVNIDFTKTQNIKFDNLADECLSLSSSELDVEELNPPSPEPSIHVDLQEYSSENGSLPPQRTNKLGWTLYNNVVDQVNQILQNSPLNDNSEEETSDGIINKEKKEYDNNVIMDTVKAATLEQLTKLGISFSDNIEQREPNYNKKVIFDASCYSRPIPEAHLTTTSGSIETNTSIHMKALAMKYLNEDQLTDMALQKPRSNNLKQGSNNIHINNNTNMSFATMHYLQRYHLLPGSNSSPNREARREEQRAARPVINERLAKKTKERRQRSSPHRYQTLSGSAKISYPSKILDISTLKQQPKLL